MNTIGQGYTGRGKEIRELRFHCYCLISSFDCSIKDSNTLRNEHSCKGSALGCRNGHHSELVCNPGCTPATEDITQKAFISLNALLRSPLSGNPPLSPCFRRQGKGTTVLASHLCRQWEMHLTSFLCELPNASCLRINEKQKRRTKNRSLSPLGCSRAWPTSASYYSFNFTSNHKNILLHIPFCGLAGRVYEHSCAESTDVETSGY